MNPNIFRELSELPKVDEESPRLLHVHFSYVALPVLLEIL